MTEPTQKPDINQSIYLLVAAVSNLERVLTEEGLKETGAYRHLYDVRRALEPFKGNILE